ncbi:MAG: glycosyltransferase, partial [Chitinivibrionales bacterium]|nr:glycosyltransferase [Chitinivibrionales bacterium]
VLEAMACGCAVVSTDNIGSREIVRDGENGILLPIGDVDGFVNIVGRLLFDTELRERLAQAGQQTARTYTWERAVDQMEDVLRSIVRTRRPAPATEVVEDDGMQLDP